METKCKIREKVHKLWDQETQMHVTAHLSPSLHGHDPTLFLQEPSQNHSPLNDLYPNRRCMDAVKPQLWLSSEINYSVQWRRQTITNDYKIVHKYTKTSAVVEPIPIVLPSRPRLMPLPLLLEPPRPRLTSLSALFSRLSFISDVPPSFPRLRFFPTVSHEFFRG